MLQNLDIQMSKMLQHSFISMCHAHYLKLMKNSTHWYKACKFTIIHKHAEEKEAVDSATRSHHHLHTIISHEPQDNSSQEVEFAVKILTAVKEVLDSKDMHTDITLQKILEVAHVTLDDYIQSISNQ